MNLCNSYAQLPGDFYTRIKTEHAPSPFLLHWNSGLAQELGLQDLSADRERLARIFSGSEPLPGGETLALAYAGHQFGNFVPQLGDGRAALIGEVIRPNDGKRFDIQLKGSGQTPYSRRGDGKSSLGPVIREYLLSEAMHRLGVPTTRALAAVATGETIYRDSEEPGGVLTRVATSHIRVGTFQYFAVRQNLSALRQLADYTIQRHYLETTEDDHPLQSLFGAIVQAQAQLIAHWMSLGFIHGVMNTDNTAVSGETLDYGPCAFLDEYQRDKVFSSIDLYGRYAYGQQARMAQWNLARLAECLLLLDDDQPTYEHLLSGFKTSYTRHYLSLMSRKLGLNQDGKDNSVLIAAWLQHLQDHSLDYSQSFIRLAERLTADTPVRFGEFENLWLARIEQQPGKHQKAAERMAASNPRVIPRNHQVARAIEAAFEGDYSVFHEMRKALSEPYTLQPGYEKYAEAPQPHERVRVTFCGT
jgi:serine/tyrosine/threonine adenylyltransferase